MPENGCGQAMPADVRPDAPMTVAPSWIEVHCVIPDGFRAGAPFKLYNDQLAYFGAFYTVRGEAEYDAVNPVLAPAFRYRRGLRVAPQKEGKSPGSAAHVCLEGVGPSIFAGRAGKDDGYACIDHGCGCGWEYPYEPGEPMGMLRPSPNIQLIAVSEDQTDNIYRALRPMIEKGPLRFLMPKTGEDFIRLPGDGLVETVTSNAQSRLGARVTFVAETEVGLYTNRNGMTKVADTLHRNLAGMSARASLETNAWDPGQHSTAQREYELVEKGKVDDVYVQFVRPPKSLSFTNKAERRKIFRIVYPADTLRENGGHVDLDAIEAEAIAMIEHDVAQATRFFGNGLVAGAGHAFDLERWKAIAAKTPHVVPSRALVVIGFDGSKRWDHTSMIATEVASGYQWPLGIWRPGDFPNREIPSDVVTNVLDQAMGQFDVWRVYADPPYWEDTVAAWAGRWGKERVLEWWTNRPKAMAYALRSWQEAQTTGATSHCDEGHELCSLFTEHVGNAFKAETGYRDDGGTLWVVTKERDGSPAKIDSVPAAVLSWEARNDALTAGALNVEPETSAYASYHSLTGEDDERDPGEDDDTALVDEEEGVLA
jgi:hypothetical protein